MNDHDCNKAACKEYGCCPGEQPIKKQKPPITNPSIGMLRTEARMLKKSIRKQERIAKMIKDNRLLVEKLHSLTKENEFGKW
jgi:hypothetical protein